MKKKIVRYFAFFMALNLLFEVVSPTVAMALTNGAFQPEFVGFEPANNSEMVDLFSGDFKYNVPLMDVDGYPLNLSYHAGPNMESEASWVGLGWSLNPGVMNRMIKGLPDDFNGESINSYTRIKPHVSMGVGYQNSSWFGVSISYQNLGAGVQVGMDNALVLTYNNYKGFGIEAQMDCNASLSLNVGPLSVGVGGGVGMTLSSQDGGTLSYQHSKSFGTGLYSATLGEGASINTRTGATTKTVFGNQSLSFGSVSIGMSTSHTLPSGSIAYSPRIPNDYTGYGFGLSVKLGLWGCGSLQPLYPISLNGGLLVGFKGFYNRSNLVSPSKTSKAYGYMYLENANDNSLMDFNRFKDGAISEEVPNGPLANKTYDIYSATAQGMASNFRPFRSDVGVMHDDYNTNNSSNLPVANETAAGLILHLLIDVMYVTQSGASGNWNTLINNTVKFHNKDVTQAVNRFFEKAYFKQLGEFTARNGSFDNSLGNEAPVAPQLIGIADGFDAAASGGLSGAPRTKRDIRANNISYLTAKQASEYGFEKTIDLYSSTLSNHNVNAGTRMVDKATTNISRKTKVTANDIVDHMSEYSLTNGAGMRYIYGIPTYNLYKKRVMFNASTRTEAAYQAAGYPTMSYSYANPLPKSNTHQIVEYNPSTDLSSNLRGSDNFYESSETPAYATSYLLTNILSADYVDLTGDGPSYDDLGGFTKFNYSKASDFKWREPYGVPSWANAVSGTSGNLSTSGTNHANLDKGLIADDLDDKAMYEYGIRENYYLQSIETKNHVAFFACTTLRDDYKGVTGEHGASASPSTYRLDSIQLYSKSEIIAKGKAQAVPIKTVYFEYDYDLCKNTFNSNAATHGKLTLKKVYFGYGRSKKSCLSPYEFYYGDNDHNNAVDAFGNPDYNTKAMDRWGNYMPNATNSGFGSDVTPDIGINGKLNNTEFPYAEQDEDLANQYAVAWNLTKLVTPTSSTIEVTYEADDYGYIQNKIPGQMLMINNSRNSINPNSDASAYSSNNNLFDANYLIIDLSKLNTGIPTAVPIATANTLVKKNMFPLKSDLYFKSFLKLGGPANSFGLKSTYWDYVPGYATIEDAGVFNGGVAGNTYTKGATTYYKYAFVRIKKEIAYGSTEVNPISFAGWDFMRSFLPKVAYPGSEPANMGDGSHKPIQQFTNVLVGLGVALADFVTGISGNPNFRFHFRNFCKEMDYSKSFVRAGIPYKKKKGGGYRIKQMLSKDGWNTMTTNTGAGTENGSVYGQVYDYTTKEGTTTISSGVAYYEPLVGGDEISLRKPIKFEIKKKMAPNDHLFQEEPFGEMLYPSGMVGYSKVTVTPIPDPATTNIYKIGKTIFEFYTAKDYPIIEGRTLLNKELFQNDLIEGFTVVEKAYKILHATQGHVLKFNDMHGKLKSINTYGEDNLNAPISGASYFYKDSPYKDGSRQLVTSARTISEKNLISVEQIARDIEVTIDNRSNLTEATTSGNSMLTETSLCSPYFSLTNNVISAYQKTGLNTSISTKIIQQYGILEKSDVFDNKSRTLSENLLWDRNTGNVVLTKSTNHVDQPVYSLNYPAYWVYPQMGSEFKREGVVIKVPANTTNIWDRGTGTITKTQVNNPELLVMGDEVIVYQNPTTPVTTFENIVKSNNILAGKRYWVTFDYNAPINGSSFHYALVDANGTILNTSSTAALNATQDAYIQVVKPAERNQLYEEAGKVSALAIPGLSGSGFAVTQKVLSSEVQTWCSGWNAYIRDGVTNQLNNCLYPTFASTPTNNDRFNPYTAGVLGNWRPASYYLYNVNRNYYSTMPNSQPNVKADGTFSSYTPFWTFSGGFWIQNGFKSSYNTGSFADNTWVLMNSNTVYSPYGYPMEQVDASGLYHAQRFGYNNTLPTLYAINAKVNQVGFESFEDYTLYYGAANSCRLISNDQMGFFSQISFSSGNSKPYIYMSEAHTGRTSLKFSPGENAALTHDINRTGLSFPAGYNREKNSFEVCSSDPSLKRLSLNAGKYITSFWVKGATAALTYSPNFSFQIEVQSGVNPAVTVTPGSIKQSGIINGWQKFDYEFDVPAYPANSTIKFKFGTNSSFYLDDFRLQPFNSQMICKVYDPLQLHLWAELDDRNYATILEYNNEGVFVRQKRETTKGVYTVHEKNSASVKRN